MDSYCLQAIISMSMWKVERIGGGPKALELDYKLLLDRSRSKWAPTLVTLASLEPHEPLVQQCSAVLCGSSSKINRNYE